MFFYNPTTKTSVWERPPELAGRPDVTEMLKSQSAAEKHKKKSASGGDKASEDSGSDSDSDEGPASKKPKGETQLVFADEVEVTEEKKGDGEVVILQVPVHPSSRSIHFSRTSSRLIRGHFNTNFLNSRRRRRALLRVASLPRWKQR